MATSARWTVPPFDHEVRRRILRRLNRSGPLAAEVLAADLGLGVSAIAYHVGVLSRWGVARESILALLDPDMAVVESAVEDDQVVAAMLRITEADDENP